MAGAVLAGRPPGRRTPPAERCSGRRNHISEGAGRATNNQFKYFLEIAMGSANELQSQIELSRRLKFISDVESESLSRETQEIYKMILGLYNKLK